MNNVLEGLKLGTLSGYTVTAKRIQKKWILQNGICEQCMLGKSKLPSFSRATTSKGESPGDYLVTDIMGPFATETFDSEKYALTYTDWYSKYSWTFLLKNKSDALTCLKRLIGITFKAARVELRHYHSDNAGELCGKETIDFLELEVHATHSTSEAYTPQRNAVAERKFRTLGEMAATMLHESGLPHVFWGYAFQAATYVRNRIPSVPSNGRLLSPYELWTNKVPSIRHLRRWGCKCYKHIPKATQAKDFLPKCHIGYLVGYTEENSYLIWLPEKRKTITAISVVFDERIPDHKESYWAALAQSPQDNIPTGDVEDYKYLVGKQYIDPDYGCKFETTRVVVERGLIVSYRVPVKLDGTKNSIEEPNPMHVKDVVQMLNTPTEVTSGKGTALPPSTTPVGLRKSTVKSRKRKRLITSYSAGATVPRIITKPLPKTHKRGAKYISRHKATVSLLRRSRRQRQLLNASILGDVGYNVSGTVLLTTPGSTEAGTVKPDNHPSNTESSIMQYAFMITHEDMVPRTYTEAMDSPCAEQWQDAIEAEVRSLIELGTWIVVDFS